MKLRLLKTRGPATGAVLAAIAISLATPSTASALQADAPVDVASTSTWTTDQITLVTVIGVLLVALALAGRGRRSTKLRAAIVEDYDGPFDPIKGARVEACDLSRRLGGRWVVSQARFTTDPGSLTAIVGLRGAGKSHLLGLVAGADKATAGDATVGEISQQDDLKAFRSRVGFVERRPSLYPRLTVTENLRYFTKLFNMNRHESEVAIAGALGLTSLAADSDTLVADLSAEQQQRVAIARAVLPRPGVLLIDDPYGSHDNARTKRVDSLLWDLRQTGMTVLFTTDDRGFDRSMAAADQVLVMSAGSLVHRLDPAKTVPAEADRIFSEFLEVPIGGVATAPAESSSVDDVLNVGLIDISDPLAGIDRTHERWMVQ